MKIVHIGIHGRHVPSWIQKVTKTRKDSVLGRLTWLGVNIVLAKGNEFHIYPMIRFSGMTFLAGARHIHIEGQSPNGGPGMVYWWGSKPIIPGWFIFVLSGSLLIGGVLKIIAG